MRLTTKGRFAVTAMADLVQYGGRTNPITLSAISDRQKISLSYLEQLFSKLRRNKIVVSIKGPGGGYSLAKLPEKVSIADIIFAVDESIDATNCRGKKNCKINELSRSKECATHQLWSQLNKKIIKYLHSISLKDLIDQEENRQAKKIKTLENKNT